MQVKTPAMWEKNRILNRRPKTLVEENTDIPLHPSSSSDVPSETLVRVTQSCPTLCDPMDCTTPGIPVHHQFRNLVKLVTIQSVMSSNYLILCHPLLLLPSMFPSIRVFFQ